MSDTVRYPIGRFQFVTPTSAIREQCIRQFEESPRLLRQAVAGLTGEQLLSRYRPGGWTLAQVVHHIVEADVNAYPRMKYALTEDVPEVLVANEARWSEVADAKSASIEASLALCEALRRRWVEAWRLLSEADFGRLWKHAHFGVVPLDHLLQQYAWHARHHTAQITAHRAAMKW